MKRLCNGDCGLKDPRTNYYSLPCDKEECEYRNIIFPNMEDSAKFKIELGNNISREDAQESLRKLMTSYKEEIPFVEEEKIGNRTLAQILEETQQQIEKIEYMVNNKKEALVVNLFAGPGSGKSTICAHLFAELKWAGVNCEMALEFAKDKVWEGSEHVLENQPYIFGKQLHRLHRLKDKVDVIITDSPLLLSIMYDTTRNMNFEKFVVDKFNGFKNKNFYIKRNKKYKTEGRLQSFDKAKTLDIDIYNIMVKYNVMFREFDGTRELAKQIADEIIEELNYEKS